MVAIFLIGIALFEITIHLGPDEDCWEDFKENGCDIVNPQNQKCIKLRECLSGDNLQLNIAYLIGCIISSFGAMKFRKQIKFLLTKGLNYWESLISNVK